MATYYKSSGDSGTGYDTQGVIKSINKSSSDSGIGSEASALTKNISLADSDSGVGNESESLSVEVYKSDSDSGVGSETESLIIPVTKESADTGVGTDTEEVEKEPESLPFLEVALNQSIFTESPAWTGITEYLKAIHVERGRMHELDRIEAGTAIFTVSNEDGIFWRSNPLSFLYPYLKPLTLIRFYQRYVHEGIMYYPIFYGVIEDVGHDWQNKDAALGPLATIECVDVFKSLSRAKIVAANPSLLIDADAAQDVVYVDSTEGLFIGQSIKIYDDNSSEVNTIEMILPEYNSVIMVNNLANSYSTGDNAKLKKFPQVKSGTRVRDVLCEWGWPAGLTRIDDGQVDVIEFTPPIGGTNSLEHIQKIAEAEDGLFFQAVDGYLTFLDSKAMLKDDPPYDKYSTSQATFIDDGTDSKYSIPKVADEDEFIYNEAEISGDGITTQKFVGSTQAEQGQRALTRSDSLIANETDAFDQCYIIVSRYTDSILRPRVITIKPEAEPDDLYPKVFGFDLKTRITLQLNSAVNPANINQEYHIEGIIHDWSIDGQWTTEYQLWETNQYRIFRCINDGWLKNVWGEPYTYQEVHDDLTAAFLYQDEIAGIQVGQMPYIPFFENDIIDRGLLKFDSGSISTGGDWTIVEAWLILMLRPELVIYNKTEFDLCIVGNGDAVFNLVPSDYGELLGQTEIYGRVTIPADFAEPDPFDPVGVCKMAVIELNAAGRAHINKYGTSFFGLRSDHDILSIPPIEETPEIDGHTEHVLIDGHLSAFIPRLVVRLAKT